MTDAQRMKFLRRRLTSSVLAVVDDREHVLLCRFHGKSSWQPVKARVIRVRPSRFSVINVLGPFFSHWTLAATPVVGSFDPLAERVDLAGLMHIFVVRRVRMRPIGLRVRAHSLPHADYVWHPLSHLEDGDLDVYPRELGSFVRGYLEGWIPDGFITLIE